MAKRHVWQRQETDPRPRKGNNILFFNDIFKKIMREKIENSGHGTYIEW